MIEADELTEIVRQTVAVEVRGMLREARAEIVEWGAKLQAPYVSRAVAAVLVGTSKDEIDRAADRGDITRHYLRSSPKFSRDELLTALEEGRLRGGRKGNEKLCNPPSK